MVGWKSSAGQPSPRDVRPSGRDCVRDCQLYGEPPLQPKRNTRSENIRARFVKFLTSTWLGGIDAASKACGDSENDYATTSVSDRPSTLAGACRPASKLRDSIEI